MKNNKLFGSNVNDSAITIGNMIEIYQSLINSGKMKLGSAGHRRMNQLKLRYSKGERYFQK
tara:strand:- start:3718 stop:3900 length:183 start_codon:yes stop_codon:yes gene_type:complete